VGGPAGRGLRADAPGSSYDGSVAGAAGRLRAAAAYLRADAQHVERALVFAAKAHRGQKRKSGEPYIIHPIETACILADQRMDTDTLIAGLLHDTVEDTSVTVDDIRREFGSGVARIVAGVTDGEGLPRSDTERELLLNISADWRIALVKLADRLHNMRTLQHMPVSKRFKKARETLALFVPLAQRLGVDDTSDELLVLCSAHLFPEAAGICEAWPAAERIVVLFAQAAYPRSLEDVIRGDQTLAKSHVRQHLEDHRRTWQAHANANGLLLHGYK